MVPVKRYTCGSMGQNRKIQKKRTNPHIYMVNGHLIFNKGVRLYVGKPYYFQQMTLNNDI